MSTDLNAFVVMHDTIDRLVKFGLEGRDGTIKRMVERNEDFWRYALVEECAEVLNELGYKPWKSADVIKAMLELGDVWYYVVVGFGRDSRDDKMPGELTELMLGDVRPREKTLPDAAVELISYAARKKLPEVVTQMRCMVKMMGYSTNEFFKMQMWKSALVERRYAYTDTHAAKQVTYRGNEMTDDAALASWLGEGTWRESDAEMDKTEMRDFLMSIMS